MSSPRPKNHIEDPINDSEVNSVDLSRTDSVCDSTWCASHSIMDEYEEEMNNNVSKDSTDKLYEARKFVVFKDSIRTLLHSLKCNQCEDGGCVDSTDLNLIEEGTSIRAVVKCVTGHHIIDWKSQPMQGKLPAYNFILSASIFLTGATYEHVSKVISLSGLKMVGKNTFYGVQRNLLIPAVNETYEKTTAAARDEVRGLDQTV